MVKINDLRGKEKYNIQQSVDRIIFLTITNLDIKRNSKPGEFLKNHMDDNIKYCTSENFYTRL